jgi:hypothetical protein
MIAAGLQVGCLAGSRISCGGSLESNAAADHSHAESLRCLQVRLAWIAQQAQHGSIQITGNRVPSKHQPLPRQLLPSGGPGQSLSAASCCFL